ncbi:MAG: Asp-tRNA(Asn)/Glu-tRNA(Gln) amidotransferase subunit GatA [Eubacteriales bacterium]|nr:Asp-tRNA(Asn)/Glu-tRNA(Gln) amidotransferase subunit GatA [Eubacteriales bacterium]
MSIRTMHNGLLKKEFSTVEFARAYLRRAEETRSLNAYIHMTPETALDAATRIDRAIAAGSPLSPLAGIPMQLKDNLSTRNILTTCASRMLGDYVPVYDASVWKTLQSCGAVLLGKGNMDEFAMGSSSETSAYGPVRNPWNERHTPGGSSGGGAAAVAAGAAAYALGSDTGGSVRLPASFCGVVGLKPTYGAVSRYGLLAYASSLDQVGPIAQSVEDAAIVFDEIACADPQDSTCHGKREGCAAGLRHPLKGRRIGIAPEFFHGAEEEIRGAIERTLAEMESHGAELVEIKIPHLQEMLSAYYIIACAEAASNLARYDGIRYGQCSTRGVTREERIRFSRSEGFGAEVKRRILLGNYALSSGYYEQYYGNACALRQRAKEIFSQAFASCDVIACPTCPRTAPALGQGALHPADGYAWDICTVPANLAGLPALSQPCGLSHAGLPLGIQWLGRPFDESTLLNVAWHCEQQANFQMLKQEVSDGV